jgi:DNA-binding XRE family transcriptional regulator
LTFVSGWIFSLTYIVAIDYNIFMDGNELKEWRRNQKLTQGALADLLGVHRVTIAKWEACDRGIPPFLPLALKSLEIGLHEGKENGQSL